MTVAAIPVQGQTLSASPQSLTFTAQLNGGPQSLQLNVDSTASGVFVIATAVETTSSQVAWLSVSPQGGMPPLALAVTVNPALLTAAGTYTGSIVISVTGNSISVPVTLNINTILASPSSLAFASTYGSTQATPGLLSITLTSGTAVGFSATASTTSGGNWLLVTPPTGFIAGSSGSGSAVTAYPDPTVLPTLPTGVYDGMITITPTTLSSSTPLTVPVTLTITPAPPVTVNPTSVSLNYQINGTNNVLQKFVTLSTTSSAGVPFTVTATSDTNPSGGVWVLAAPLSGSITSSGAPLSIAYNTNASLPAGTYHSTVTVSTPGGSPAATAIPVTLVVANTPLLNVPTDTLTFTYELGGAYPPAQPVTVTATSGNVPFLVTELTNGNSGNWLTVPSNGTTPTPFNVSVNPAGLAPGTYTGTVFVTGGAVGPQQFPVTLKVSNDPFLVSSLPSLEFVYQISQIPGLTSQPITLSSSSGVPLQYSVAVSAGSCASGWLSISGATSGTTNGAFTATVSPLSPVPLGAGTCQGTLTVTATNTATGANAVNSPLTIPVKLVVSTSAELVVSPMSPAVFTTPVNGAAQSTTYTFASTSATDAVNFSIAASTVNGGNNWLQVSAVNGQTGSSNNKVTVTAQPAQLAAGTYTGTVTVTATGPAGAAVADSPYLIPVTLTVTQGALTLAPNALTFKQATGGAAPVAQTVLVSSSGQPLNFAASAYTSGSVAWLQVSPSGSTPGSVQVSVNGASLPVGTYTGTVTVTSTTPYAGNSPASIAVTLNVNAGTISASAPSLAFSQVQGGPAPPALSVSVAGAPGPISFTAAGNGGTSGLSVSVSPNSATTPATLQVTADAGSLPVGSYTGNVTITAANADGSPLAIPVTVNVLAPHNLSVSPTIVNLAAPAGSTVVQTETIVVASAGGTTSYSVAVSAGASWLTVLPTSGNTPDTLTVTANPAGLAPNGYTATLTITSPNAISPVAVAVNLVVGTLAPPVLNAVANAANYSLGTIAPGENVVLFGSGIGPPTLTKGTVTNGVVDSVIAGTRVLFDGIPAPLIYASTTQTSAMVPYEISGHSITSVVVEYIGVPSSGVAYTVAVAAPGIYTQNAQGSGPGAILNQDYSLNLASTPAAKGSYVEVYMTGEGFTVGAVDGLLATSLLSPVLPVTATVAGLPASVYYAGTAPGIVTGAMQVNILIPLNAPSGNQPIVITVGSGPTALSTQSGVTVAVK